MIDSTSRSEYVIICDNFKNLINSADYKVGWYLLILSVIVELAKALFVRNIDLALYFAKASHIIFIVSIFLICLSKEKVEDEMISGFRPLLRDTQVDALQIK